MNKKTENLEMELEELIPLFVRVQYLQQIIQQKEADIVERYTTLGFTVPELEEASKKVYNKLVERKAVPGIELPEENKLITEL